MQHLHSMTLAALAGAALAAGAALLLSPPLAAQHEIHELKSDVAGGEFGSDLAGIGDVDGDDYADIAVGDWEVDINGADSGAVRVFSGRTGALLWGVDGDDAGDLFGIALSAAGDVNGDGVPDVLAGAYGDDEFANFAGSVSVLSGVDGALLLFLHGEAGDGLGSAVAGVGDVDGDGVPDILAGAAADTVNGFNAGSASLISGADGALLAKFLGDKSGDFFGASAAGAGDVDADGTPDLVIGVGEILGGDPGYVRVFSGRDFRLLHEFHGEDVYDFFGDSVDGAGDVDGDGHADIVVGVTGDATTVPSAGSVRVYSGRTGALLFKFDGDQEGEFFGLSVAGVGDVDQDGRDDVLVGAPFYDFQGPDRGRALLFSGADGSVLADLLGKTGSVLFGHAVAGLGDVNRDGFPDYVVGSPFFSAFGRAYVESGACGGLLAYGSGCPGSGGFTPQLQIDACATPGGIVNLLVSEGLGNSMAALFLGLQPASIPIAGGCTALLVPVGPVLFLPLTSFGNVKIAGNLPMGLPNGASFVMQAFVVDPGVPQGFSTTNGVQITIE